MPTLYKQNIEIPSDAAHPNKQVGQAKSDFTTQAYLINHLIWVDRLVKIAPESSDAICGCPLISNNYYLQYLQFIDGKFPFFI